MKDWADKRHFAELNGRELYVGVDTSCVQFKGISGFAEVTPIIRLDCNHPEADTRICLHAIDADISLQQPGDIVVRASDTDVAVILLHHCHSMKASVWMDVGSKGQSNRRYINISAIANKIGSKVCEALPGFHAYTGCDYTSSLIRKGKKRPLKIAEDNQDYIVALSALAMGEVDKSTCKLLEEYTAKIYGAKKVMPLNKYGFLCFEKSFGPKKGKGPFASLKGVDASSMPPCENVNQQKIHRSNFVAMTWHAACDQLIPTEPLKGWELVN